MGKKFPPSARLHKSGEFTLTFKEGKKISGNKLDLYVRLNLLTESRLGLIVSGKVGGAVLRNRLKRKLREIFRLNRELFREPVDLVIRAKPGRGAVTDYHTLSAEVLGLLNQKGFMVAPENEPDNE